MLTTAVSSGPERCDLEARTSATVFHNFPNGAGVRWAVRNYGMEDHRMVISQLSETVSLSCVSGTGLGVEETRWKRHSSSLREPTVWQERLTWKK